MKPDTVCQCLENCLRIYLPSEVDETSCEQISQLMKTYMAKQPVRQVVFDFTNTVFMDSAGIGMLLARYKEMSFIKGQIFLTGESERIEKMLKMSGIYTIMTHISQQ